MQVIGSAGEPVTAEVQHGFSVMAAHAFQIQVWHTSTDLHCKKRLAVFPSPAGMSQTKLFLDNSIKIIPGRGEFG
jgi:hypothetical protein